MPECKCGCGQTTTKEFARGHVQRGLPWPDRFWAKVDQSGECWEWLAYRDRMGYGRYRKDGTGPSEAAHRVAYKIEVGPIPDGLVLDHLCRNRGCVRPSHLEPVTRRENIIRSPILLPDLDDLRYVEATADPNGPGKRCLRGHLMTEANWDVKNRRCRACSRQQKRDAYRAARLAGKGDA